MNIKCMNRIIPVEVVSFKFGFDVLKIDVPDALNRGRELSIKRAKNRKQLDAVPRSVSQSIVCCCSRWRRSFCEAAKMPSFIT